MATLRTPRRCRVRITRRAISPRLATSTDSNISVVGRAFAPHRVMHRRGWGLRAGRVVLVVRAGPPAAARRGEALARRLRLRAPRRSRAQRSGDDHLLHLVGALADGED